VGRHRHQHRAADDRRAGGLADVERELIRIRTGEGRSRAKASRKGHGPTKEATRRRAQGATLQELADSYDRSISTMRRVTRPNLSAATWGYSFLRRKVAE
jgi:hypothetical protein